MAEQEKKPGGADGKKKKFYNGWFARGAMTDRSTYKSKVQGLENDTFNVGASSNPTKFSKLLKNIKNSPEDIEGSRWFGENYSKDEKNEP